MVSVEVARRLFASLCALFVPAAPAPSGGRPPGESEVEIIITHTERDGGGECGQRSRENASDESVIYGRVPPLAGIILQLRGSSRDESSRLPPHRTKEWLLWDGV